MLSESEEIKISFDTLERGQMYPIIKIERTESCFYGKKVAGLKVTIDDDGTQLITYLPKKLVESVNDQEFQKIETAAQTDQKYSVCYYGKLKTKNVESFTGRIHPPGQGKTRVKAYTYIVLKT